MPEPTGLIEIEYPILNTGSDQPDLDVHGTVGSPIPGREEEALAFANLAAVRALYQHLKGEWLTNSGAGEIKSDQPMVGQPTQPITVLMDDDGKFTVSAPDIAIDEIGLSISVGLTVKGRLDASVSIEDGWLTYAIKPVEIDVTESKALIGGEFDLGLLLAPAVEAIVGKYQTAGKFVYSDPDEKEPLESIVINTDGLVHVIERLRSGHSRSRLNPRPGALLQPTIATCWATAMASFFNVLHTGKMISEAKGFDLTPPWTVQSVVTFAPGRFDDWNAEQARKGKKGRLEIHPNNSLLMITGISGSEGWTAAMQCFDPSLVANELKPGTLTIAMIKASIDTGNYILLCFQDPGFNYQPGEPGYDPSAPTYWHCVVVYGYDTKLEKMLIMDPKYGDWRAIYIEPTFTYAYIPRQPHSWP